MTSALISDREGLFKSDFGPLQRVWVLASLERHCRIPSVFGPIGVSSSMSYIRSRLGELVAQRSARTISYSTGSPAMR